jgi:hypothetical protein
MSVWRGSAGRRLGAAVLLAGSALAGWGAGASSVLAQTSGQPIQLLPPAPAQAAPAPPAPPGATPPLGPVAPSGPLVPGAAPAPGPTGPSGIQVQEIGSEESYAGPLDPAQGGLGYDLWKGTSARDLEVLLAQIPLPGASPAMRALARRLLLSSAEAPVGKADRDLLALRAERLATIGRLADMESFLAVVPQNTRDATLAAFRREVMWLKGDVDSACGQVDADLAVLPGDVELARQQILCQAAAGQAKLAQLGIDMLREQGHSDPKLVLLADALAGSKDAKLPADLPPSAALYALLKKANLPVPPDWVDKAGPALLARLAEDDTLDGAARLAAAERAFAAGALDVETLTKLYAAQPATPQEIDQVLAAEDRDDGPRGRALLYQGVQRAQQPPRRAQILHRALEMARRFGGYPMAVDANLNFLLRLQPGPELAWFAGDAGRAFYLAGHYERAQAWLNIARNRAEADAQARAAVPTLALFAQIAGAGQPLVWAPNAAEQWRDAQAKAGDPDPATRAARLFAVLSALGEPVGDGWRQLVGGDQAAASSIPDATLLGRLDAAAAAGRRGEAVLISLVAAGPGGPAGAHPLVVNRILSALNAVGLESEARAIAFETVIANGI